MKRTPRRILNAATRMFGQMGYRGASMADVAEEAGVSKSLVHYHFHSKERLLIEAQRATFRELHRRFSEQAQRGEQGLPAALDALDGIWTSVRTLRSGAPFIVETLSLAAKEGTLNRQLRSFSNESTSLLADGIHLVFAQQVHQLTIPPERMARLIRILLQGLTLELAQAHTPEDLSEVDQSYADLKALFSRFVIDPLSNQTEPKDTSTNSIPLPW